MKELEGWGKPGGLKWHKAIIFDCSNFAQIASYVKKVTGKKLFKVKPIGKAKRQALKMVNEALKK